MEMPVVERAVKTDLLNVLFDSEWSVVRSKFLGLDML